MRILTVIDARPQFAKQSNILKTILTMFGKREKMGEEQLNKSSIGERRRKIF